MKTVSGRILRILMSAMAVMILQRDLLAMPDHAVATVIVPLLPRCGLALVKGALLEDRLMESTGDEFDIAIQGDGLFQVRLPNGEFAYTRDGRFRLTEYGSLVTREGYPLQYPIALPYDTTRFTVDSDGTVQVVTRSNPAQCVIIGNITLTTFSNPYALKISHWNLLRETPESGPGQQGIPGSNGVGILQQGFQRVSPLLSCLESIQCAACAPGTSQKPDADRGFFEIDSDITAREDIVMRSRLSQSINCVIQTVALAVGQQCAFAGPPGNLARQAVISLSPKCTVSDGEVLISHVARIETSDAKLKDLIGALDVIEAPRLGDSATVTPKLIELRLRLAGFDLRNISIKGSSIDIVGGGPLSAIAQDLPRDSRRADDPIIVTRFTTQPQSVALPPQLRADLPQRRQAESQQEDVADERRSLEERIVATARQAILDVLPWNKADITFHLAQPIAREAKLAESSGKCVCTAQLRSTGAPVGRVTVDVTVKYPDQAAVDIAVAFDVRHYETVVATARPIARGRTIQKDDLYMHRWDVTGATDYCTRSELIVGRVASRTLAALQIIKDQDIEKGLSNGQEADRPIVIKRQDRVNMTAKIGDSIISVRGEALQDGRIGDTIRVQNVESKTVIRGRVVSSEDVEVSY